MKIVKEDTEILYNEIDFTRQIIYKEVYDMAMATYNATLEYNTANTLEFWLKDELGQPVGFDDSNLQFNIKRADGTAAMDFVVPANGSNLVGGYVVFLVTPPLTLKKVGDVSADYDNDTYEHIYSVKSDSHVYLRGKLNLVDVA